MSDVRLKIFALDTIRAYWVLRLVLFMPLLDHYAAC
jgi:hypothetical protein